MKHIFTNKLGVPMLLGLQNNASLTTRFEKLKGSEYWYSAYELIVNNTGA